jgi:hypothetical protein
MRFSEPLVGNGGGAGLTIRFGQLGASSEPLLQLTPLLVRAKQNTDKGKERTAVAIIAGRNRRGFRWQNCKRRTAVAIKRR